VGKKILSLLYFLLCGALIPRDRGRWHFGPHIYSVATCTWPLYHVIWGAGVPVAGQTSTADAPTMTDTLLGDASSSTIVGATVQNTPTHQSRSHPTQRTQRKQRNERSWRSDRFYPCVLAVASAAFVAYFSCIRLLRQHTTATTTTTYEFGAFCLM